MRVKYLISLAISLTFIFFVNAQYENKNEMIQTKNIENFKIHEGEILSGFLLFQEYHLKPDDQESIQIGERS